MPRGKGPAGELLRPLGLRELLELDPAEHRWVTRRWVVRGDPGAGKTTLLRHLAATLAKEEKENPRPRRVPVFESLPRLVRERDPLLNRLARRLERAGHPAQGLQAVLDRAGQEGRLVLLFDGLDEVPKEERDEAEKMLRDVAALWPSSTLVVTTRPIGYHRLGHELLELDLLPLDAGHRREFLARWFGRRAGAPDFARADRELPVLEEDPGLRELAGNPLYLTLMALLLEKGTAPDRNRTRLYDQVFELLLEGKHRPDGEPIDCQAGVREVLRHLGYGMTLDNRDTEPVTALEARLYQPEADRLREPLERVARWRTSLRPFLDDLSRKTGILGPHDGPDADWRFWHRTFREALAAERLEQLAASRGNEAILAFAREIAGDESRWAEPFALLTGRIADPDGLVRALVEANRSLGLRALATAPETAARDPHGGPRAQRAMAGEGRGLPPPPRARRRPGARPGTPRPAAPADPQRQRPLLPGPRRALGRRALAGPRPKGRRFPQPVLQPHPATAGRPLPVDRHAPRRPGPPVA